METKKDCSIIPIHRACRPDMARRIHPPATGRIFLPALAWGAAALLLCAASLAAPPAGGTLRIGAPAPDFSLPGIFVVKESADGPATVQIRTASLADFAEARILAVIFTCNHCPTAQAYEDRIIQLSRDYKDRGVAVVAISPNDPNAVRLDELGYSDLGDSFADMKIRALDKGFNFPYLYDGRTQAVSRAYGPVATPHVFLFDKERKCRYVGRIDNSEKPANVTASDARNAIDALLAGKAVAIEETKTFGCSIKWSDKRLSALQALQRWEQEQVTLETIDEQQVKQLVQNKTDKCRLINLWATWCGPCAAEFPELIDIHRMYRQREFELVTISMDSPDKKDKVLSFLKGRYASCGNYLFSSEDKYALIEAVDEEWTGALPYTLLVAPGGKVIYRRSGSIDPLELKKAIVGHLGRYY